MRSAAFSIDNKLISLKGQFPDLLLLLLLLLQMAYLSRNERIPPLPPYFKGVSLTCTLCVESDVGHVDLHDGQPWSHLGNEGGVLLLQVILLVNLVELQHLVNIVNGPDGEPLVLHNSIHIAHHHSSTRV